MLGWLDVACPRRYVKRSGLLVGWIILIGPPRQLLVLSRVYREELGVVPAEVVLALRDAVSMSSVGDFWSTWSRHAEAGLFRASKNAEAGLFRAYCRAGGPTAAGSAYS